MNNHTYAFDTTITNMTLITIITKITNITWQCLYYCNVCILVRNPIALPSPFLGGNAFETSVSMPFLHTPGWIEIAGPARRYVASVILLVSITTVVETMNLPGLAITHQERFYSRNEVNFEERKKYVC